MAGSLALILIAGAVFGYVKYREIAGSIKHVQVKGLGKRPPVYSRNSMNVLLIGSDSRAGRNSRFGAHITGQRSDTVMVVHLSPGRRHATIISIPRDSVVPIFACRPEPGFSGQQAQPGQIEQINASFAFGGPGCLWKTVEQTTHIHIDHFIELSFTGFEKVINDLGGVAVCLPWAVNDPRSKLHLSRGVHRVWGAKALAFWRVRYIGDGSDLQRIRRDQYLMASLVHAVIHTDLLSNPFRTYSVITDAASAMTTDSGLSARTMISIAESLRGLSARAVQFIEVPTVYYPPNPSWVSWEQPQARNLFAAIAHDRTPPKAARRHAAARPPALAAEAASRIRVKVLDGSGVAGPAEQAARGLAGRRFRVVGTVGAASSGYQTSVIEYATSAQLAAARMLRAQLRHAVLRMDPALAGGPLELIIGSDYTGLAPAPGHRAPAAASSTPSPSPSAGAVSELSRLGKSDGGITGSANVCHDTPAFSGPDGHS